MAASAGFASSFFSEQAASVSSALQLITNRDLFADAANMASPFFCG
jgi:hypothetical protein